VGQVPGTGAPINGGGFSRARDMIRPMVRMTVAAHPGARVERLDLLENGELGIWVRARPMDDQANTAIESAIAKALGLRARQVSIVSGGISRRKIVDIDLPDLEALRQRLRVNEVRTD